MNKIILTSYDETKLVREYKDLVFNYTLIKLVFVIGVFAVRQRKIKCDDLKKSEFEIDNVKFTNDLKDVNRKTFLNKLFTEKNKVTSVKLIDYKKIERKTSYKKSFKSFNSTLSDLLILHHNVENILTKKLTSPSLIIILDNLKSKFKYKQDQDILEFVFDYPSYFHQTEKNNNYFGLKLAKVLNINLCIYCNREYISAISNSKGKKIISPAFDHFLSQKDYPYLAISLFNLIPSCYSCNSQLKLAEEFNLVDYLYPYDTSYENLAVFSVTLKKANLVSKFTDEEIININDLNISIESASCIPEVKIFGNTLLTDDHRKGNLKLFQTDYIYNAIHKDSVLDIITQFRVHSKKDIESLKISYKFITCESDIYQFYFNNYLNEENFNKRPLARLSRDIVKQLEQVYEVKYTI